MPFKSDEQRRFMYVKHPDIAKKWSSEEKPEPESKRKRKMLSELAEFLKRGKGDY